MNVKGQVLVDFIFQNCFQNCFLTINNYLFQKDLFIQYSSQKFVHYVSCRTQQKSCNLSSTLHSENMEKAINFE